MPDSKSLLAARSTRHAHPSQISRRRFLQGLGACAGLSLVGVPACERSPELPDGVLFSAANRFDGSHMLRGEWIGGSRVLEVTLPVRAHGVALRPGGFEVVAFARRPGLEFFVVSEDTQEVIHRIQAPPERHLLGHGVFDPSGRFLYVTENSVDDAVLPDITPRDAIISVYDADADYRRVGELPSHGVGAHELIFSPSGHLVVANGGIYTHPSRPRESLNIDTMRPSLAHISTEDGTLLERHELGDHQIGIRHLTTALDGTIYFGCQHAAPSAANRGAPLVYRQRPGGAPQAMTEAGAFWEPFDSYVGSVAVHPLTGAVAATSPVGGVVALWKGNKVEVANLADCSGASPVGDAFVVTSGSGEMHVWDAASLRHRVTVSAEETRWDNHCVATTSQNLRTETRTS